MNAITFESLAGHPVFIATGWTLLHFIWQAAIIVVFVALMLSLLSQKSAQLRYMVSCLGLAIMAIAPIVTLLHLVSTADFQAWKDSKVAENSVAFQQSSTNSAPADNALSPLNDSHLVENEPTNIKNQTDPRAENSELGTTGLAAYSLMLKQTLPILVAAWLVGVFFFALRLLFDLNRVWKLRCKCVAIKSTRLLAKFQNLRERINIALPVQLLESAKATVPAAVGVIRPVILVPTSILTGLTTAEVESILAHELAHIKRHDYLVNLIQSVVEALLFYHPAVWWMSRQIRTERENCCDDIAVSTCGDAIVFARALARIEEFRCDKERLVVAANGGSLLHRLRRIVGADPVDSRRTPWQAGAIAMGSIVAIVSGFWISAALAKAPVTNSNEFAKLEQPSPQLLIQDDEKIVTQKKETLKKDSKTGQKQRVFGDIRLQTGTGENVRQATLDMKHSNVIRYSLIPARIAKELNAKELGVIDFGATNPHRKIGLDGLSPRPNDDDDEKKITVKEVTKAVAADEKIVPYKNETLWVPGHLGFYGLNQTKQHKFRVVRIEKVALGVGPAFGPINALVLDDANSDFGLLGSDWSRKVRGKNGESLVLAAADGTLYFMNLPKAAKPRTPAPIAPKGGGGKMTVTSNQPSPTIQRNNRDGVKLLATHTYNHKQRESKAWVNVNGAKVPVDVGIEHDGYTVYLTLLFDVVAVEKKTDKVIWNLDWGKTTPIWQTVSIVELSREKKPELAVELFAVDNKTGKPIYKYVSLSTGDAVEGPSATRKNGEPVAVDEDVEGWGRLAHKSGLRSRLTMQTKEPRIGAPIQFKLEVKNFGDKPFLVDPQMYAAFRVLRVKGPDNSPAKFIGMTPQTSGNKIQLDPGKSMTLWENVDVNSLFLIESGKSKVFAEGGEWATQALWRDSNTIDIDVAKGKQDPIIRFISKLIHELPEKWGVANGAGLAKGWKGIFLTHTPTSLKRDATGIQIWFTEEKLAEDFQLGKGAQKQIVTQLGKCELGYLNIAARPKTLDIWPEYLKHIRNAASQSLTFSD